ncbi:unnamed protein product [Heterobilharzia americana]|nr:unnamed protein product [Heterobilharzia americana]
MMTIEITYDSDCCSPSSLFIKSYDHMRILCAICLHILLSKGETGSMYVGLNGCFAADCAQSL